MFLGHGPARRWRALHRHRLALTAASHSNNTAAQHLPDDHETNIKLSTWRKAGWRLDFCRQASSWVSAFATWRSPATAFSSSSPSSAPVGLFGRPGLLRPQDWIRLANETQARYDRDWGAGVPRRGPRGMETEWSTLGNTGRVDTLGCRARGAGCQGSRAGVCMETSRDMGKDVKVRSRSAPMQLAAPDQVGFTDGRPR